MPDEPIGIIYSLTEANNKYGSVISSIEISSSLLTSLFNQTDNYLMFKIMQNNLYILGDSRVVLYPANGTVDSSEVFAVYSKSKVEELIETGRESVTKVEERSEVFSLTNGNYTLEFSQWCPPFCGLD
ncbi:MAG TPA: hypothetical protein VLN45_11135 [Ignavibacteriaceae bacterium]|nr:hypothetical protein [Ignavibacteriaceae bacterium]